MATEGLVERARVRKDRVRDRDASRGGAAAVGGRRRRVPTEVVPRPDRARGRARHRPPGPPGRFRAPAFDTIVASGPNTALPHARPGERRITESDLVVLDFGGVYDSYCVDLTRTVSVGPAESAGSRGLRGGARSPRRAIAAVGPGRPGSPSTPRPATCSTRRGLGEAFGHGTGHGLGIEVHEDPRIARRRPEVDARGRGGRAGHGLHDRARRLSARVGRRSHRRRCRW